MHAIATITRLGPYNLHQAQTLGFVGLPTTCAGLVLASLLLAEPSIALSAAVLLGTRVAILVPLRIPRPRGVSMAAVVGWAVALIVAHAASAVR